jgi:hypothetical protein
MNNRFCFLLAAGLMIPGATAYSQAMTDTDCTALFSKADTNKDGSISGPELTPFESALLQGSGSGTTGSTTGSTSSTTAGGTASGSSTTTATSPMTRDQFMAECKRNASFSSVTIP